MDFRWCCQGSTEGKERALLFDSVSFMLGDPLKACWRLGEVHKAEGKPKVSKVVCNCPLERGKPSLTQCKCVLSSHLDMADPRPWQRMIELEEETYSADCAHFHWWETPICITIGTIKVSKTKYFANYRELW